MQAWRLAGMQAGRQAGREKQRETEKQGDRETSLLPDQHGFSVHHEHHLFLRLTVEELKYPLRLLLFYTPCANHLSFGTAISEHSNTHFHHTYL
jgi:hypothetical protein